MASRDRSTIDCVLAAAMSALLSSLAACGQPGGTADASAADAAADSSVDGAPADATVGPAVVLGTGTSAFVEIPETGDPVLPLIHGPQGGWHLVGAVRLYGLELDGLLLSYETTDATDGTVLSFPLQVELSPRRVTAEDDHFVRLGDRVIFMIFDPTEVEGRLVDLSVTATPTTGDPVSDSRRVTVGMETLPGG